MAREGGRGEVDACEAHWDVKRGNIDFISSILEGCFFFWRFQKLNGAFLLNIIHTVSNNMPNKCLNVTHLSVQRVRVDY